LETPLLSLVLLTRVLDPQLHSMTARTPFVNGAPDFSLFGGAEILPPSLSLPSGSRSSSSSSSSDDDPTLSDSEEAVKELPGMKWAPKVVQPVQDRNDWLWLMTEEPHRSRRKAILKAHPEVSRAIIYACTGGVGRGQERGRGQDTSLVLRARWEDEACS
jgi:hypothetical protein